MLKHCIILPVDERHFYNFDLLQSKELIINIIFAKEFSLKDSESFVEPFGEELVKKSKIKQLKTRENMPLALNQLALIDFNKFDSYHLVGDIKQLLFFTQMMRKLGLGQIKIYFSNTNEIENADTIENIFYIQNLNNEEKIKNYISYILKNTQPKPQNLICKKYHICTNATMIANKNYFSTLYIENEWIISSYFKTPQAEIIKSKKLKKLKEKPFLFFKDLVSNRIRKIKHRLK